MIRTSKKVRVPDLAVMKERGERIVMLTAYDATMARLLDRAGHRPVRLDSFSQSSDPISSVSLGPCGRDDHACWSDSPMPRSDRCHPFRAGFRQSWLIGLVLTMEGRLVIGLVLATGCAHSQTDLQDRLARRVGPMATEPVPSANQVEGKTSVRPTADGRVQLAGATQPGQSTEARTENDRTTPLPPAIAGPPRRSDSERPSSPADVPSERFR